MVIFDWITTIIFIVLVGITISLVRGIILHIFKKDKKSIYAVFEELKKHAKNNIFKYSIVFIAVIIITLFTSRNLLLVLGSRNLKTIPNGDYTYYVKMKKADKDKEYTLPALISKTYNCDEDVDNKLNCSSIYLLNKVYFSNGGYLYFEDDNELYINKKVSLYDYKGDKYEITLINEHAYVEGVNESKPPIRSFIILIYMIVMELMCWLIPLYLISKEDKKE